MSTSSPLETTTTDYTSLPSNPVEEQPNDQGSRRELQVHLYREDGFYFRRPLVHSTSFKDARPSHFPPFIDMFLWGGLSTKLEEVIHPYEERMNRAYLSAFVLVFVPILWLITVGWIGMWTRDTNWYYVILVVTPILLSIGLDGCITRRISKPLPTQIEIALNDIRPQFHKAGYDLQLVVRKANVCLSSVVYIRFQPMRNGEISSRAEEVGSNDDPTDADTTSSACGQDKHPKENFRVAVYGRKAVVTSLVGTKEYHFMNGRPLELQSVIDAFTWGAVASEVRPLTTQYMSVSENKFLWCLVLLQIFVWLPESMDESPWFIFFAALAFSTIFVVGDAPAEQVFPVILWIRQEPLQKMQDKIRELAPKISARSGYDLSFEVERSCCGCATAAYIRFQPSSNNPHSTHSGLDFV